jgi:diguanylate cyclase (GGDEF)-like protein/PAS domain S-box-containing protein
MNWQFPKYAGRCNSYQAARKLLNWVAPALPGGIAAIAVASLLKLGAWQPLEQTAYNLLFHLRGATPWDDRVVVIAIDEPSLKQLGRFPWSRQRYTQLLNILSPAEPDVVGLDVLLPEPSEDDRLLAKAIEQQSQVVLAYAWDSFGLPLPPTSQLRSAALTSGHVLKREDTDGLTRQIDLQIQGIPTLGLAAIQVYSLVQEPVPLPPLQQPFMVNWAGPAQQLNQVSFVDVLQGKVPASTFHRKIVLVGVTATGLDALQTPYDRSPPASGVHLHATIISNLLQQNWLHPLDPRWLVLIFLLGGPGLSVAMTRWHIGRQVILLLALCCGWGVLSLGSFSAGYLLPVATPIVLFGVTGSAVVLYERLRMNELLRQSEERYALAVRGTNEGLWDWNLLTQDIYFSPRWKSILGLQDLGGKDEQELWFNRVHPDDLTALREAITNHLNGLTQHFEHEYRLLHADGAYRWVLCRGLAIMNDRGEAYRMAGSQADITARKWAEEKLRYHAFYDELTGLPNRTLFLERLQRVLACANGDENLQPAVLFIDLDRFKVINDSLGHIVGDQLLVAIAHRLEHCLRTGDTIARLGGDEFTILLENISHISEAKQIADRIHAEIALPFKLGEHEIFTSASIGIVLGKGYTQPENLLRDADTAMYRAKTMGKSRSEVFDPTMHTHTLTLLQLETDLRRALERQEFCIYYQPIVSLTTGKITGFEALIRWQHPKRGLLSPVEFLHVAEETGLIALIDLWMLQQAHQQLQIWQQQFTQTLPLTVSVNFSGVQFTRPDVLQQVNHVLHEARSQGCNLKLEITESVIMVNTRSAVDVLENFRRQGIELCIDDFGTGYSSLGRLHRLPINTLKIDRSFVKRVAEDGESWEIVRAIVTLAHNLGLDVIAEGIETSEQATQLQALRCEYGQGYYYSRPIDSKTVEALLERSPQWSEHLN